MDGYTDQLSAIDDTGSTKRPPDIRAVFCFIRLFVKAFANDLDANVCRSNLIHCDLLGKR
ncbi:hypothetical protein [Paenibacillus campi]|uniref:hypothetical protein n=1 Tax=Paenibacillus campi TaxID=3106031 RepID=UPI002AFE4F46|nr:hypothetical protein [Paenibacillus sp. SGZ-1014]